LLALKGGRPVRVKRWPSWPIYDEHEIRALEDVVRSRYWGGGVARSGPWEAEFEGRFARYHGCKYGVCVSNGTVALHVALLAAGIGPEDEVIVPDLTFWATGSAVLMTGATPIVVDVDPETCCLDVCKAEEAVTDKTKAIIPVYNYGTAPDMDRLVKLAKDHGLIMIEDCARGHGFMWGDKPAGSIGDMGCFSFQQGKFMTAGEGGIIITNSKMYEERCHSIKDCGRVREGYKYSGEVLNWFNYRMTQFQAAILLAQLDRFEEQLKTRQRNSEYLSKRLMEIDGITPVKVDHRLTRHQPWPYAFKYDSSLFRNAPLERLIEALNAEGVPCWRTEPPLHESLKPLKGTRAYKLYVEERDKAKERFPVSVKAYHEELVELPQNIFLATEKDMDDIAEAIIKIQKYADEL